MAAQLLARDRAQMHLVRPVGQMQGAQLGPRHGQRRVVRDARPRRCTWIARSSTYDAARGAATLIAAISVRALRTPAVSMSQAVLSTSSRACSIASRDSAIHSWTMPCLAMGWPNVERDWARAAHQLERALRDAQRAHAVMDPAGAEARLRHHEAAALRAEQVLARHPDIVVVDDAVPAVRAVVVAEHGRGALDRHARACPAARGSSSAARTCAASGSLTPITIAILHSGRIAPVDHHLRPSTT